MDVKTDNVKIEQMTQYKYSEAIIERNGNLKTKINEKVQSATRLHYALNKSILNRKHYQKNKNNRLRSGIQTHINTRMRNMCTK